MQAGYLAFKRIQGTIRIYCVVWLPRGLSLDSDVPEEAVECYVCLNYKFGKLSPNKLSLLCMLNFSEAELAISCYFFLHFEQEVVWREMSGLSNVIQGVKVSCLEAELTRWLIVLRVSRYFPSVWVRGKRGRERTGAWVTVWGSCNRRPYNGNRWLDWREEIDSNPSCAVCSLFEWTKGSLPRLTAYLHGCPNVTRCFHKPHPQSSTCF